MDKSKATVSDITNFMQTFLSPEMEQNCAAGQSPSDGSANGERSAAIDRYYEELKKGGVRAPVMDKDLWDTSSPEQLIQQVRLMVRAGSGNPNSCEMILKRLELILLRLNDFAAVIAWTWDMDVKVAAIIWGSMRLVLKVVVWCHVHALLNWSKLCLNSRSLSYRISLICWKSWKEVCLVSVLTRRIYR